MNQNYSAKIKAHYHYPKNFGILPGATHTAEGLNPMCGDEIKIYLKLKDGKIADFRYIARGCMLAIAAASVLSETLKGKPAAPIKKLTLDDIQKLLETEISPARQNCAELALQTLKKMI